MYVLVDLNSSRCNSFVASVLMTSLTQKIVIISTYVVGSTEMQCFIADGTEEDAKILRQAGFVLEVIPPPQPEA